MKCSCASKINSMHSKQTWMHLKWSVGRRNGWLLCVNCKGHCIRQDSLSRKKDGCRFIICYGGKVWVSFQSEGTFFQAWFGSFNCCLVIYLPTINQPIKQLYLTLTQTSFVFPPGKMWRRRSVVQASQGDGRPCPSQMEQWKPCPVRPCYRWQYSPWSECRVEVGQ